MQEGGLGAAFGSTMHMASHSSMVHLGGGTGGQSSGGGAATPSSPMHGSQQHIHEGLAAAGASVSGGVFGGARGAADAALGGSHRFGSAHHFGSYTHMQLLPQSGASGHFTLEHISTPSHSGRFTSTSVGGAAAAAVVAAAGTVSAPQNSIQMSESTSGAVAQGAVAAGLLPSGGTSMSVSVPPSVSASGGGLSVPQEAARRLQYAMSMRAGSQPLPSPLSLSSTTAASRAMAPAAPASSSISTSTQLQQQQQQEEEAQGRQLQPLQEYSMPATPGGGGAGAGGVDVGMGSSPWPGTPASWQAGANGGGPSLHASSIRSYPIADVADQHLTDYEDDEVEGEEGEVMSERGVTAAEEASAVAMAMAEGPTPPSTVAPSSGGPADALMTPAAEVAAQPGAEAAAAAVAAATSSSPAAAASTPFHAAAMAALEGGRGWDKQASLRSRATGSLDLTGGSPLGSNQGGGHDGEQSWGSGSRGGTVLSRRSLQAISLSCTPPSGPLPQQLLYSQLLQQQPSPNALAAVHGSALYAAGSNLQHGTPFNHTSPSPLSHASNAAGAGGEGTPGTPGGAGAVQQSLLYAGSGAGGAMGGSGAGIPPMSPTPPSLCYTGSEPSTPWSLVALQQVTAANSPSQQQQPHFPAAEGHHVPLSHSALRHLQQQQQQQQAAAVQQEQQEQQRQQQAQLHVDALRQLSATPSELAGASPHGNSSSGTGAGGAAGAGAGPGPAGPAPTSPAYVSMGRKSSCSTASYSTRISLYGAPSEAGLLPGVSPEVLARVKDLQKGGWLGVAVRAGWMGLG